MLEHSLSSTIINSGINSPKKSNSNVGSPSKFITVVDVYDLAEEINRDFEDLAKKFGKDPIETIVRKVICALETLEAFAKNNDRDNLEILDLQKSIELYQQEKEVIELEDNYKKEIDELCRLVKSLQTENKKIQQQLSIERQNAESISRSLSPEHKSSLQSEFGEDFHMVLDLRQQNSKQKEQIKELICDAKAQNSEIETLKNCVEKLMRQNSEMIRKNTALQKQGRNLIQERAELMKRLQHTEETNFRLRQLLTDTSRACKDMESQRQYELREANEDSPRFTLGELREVLQEKNLLKVRVLELEEQVDFYRTSTPSSSAADMSDIRDITSENLSSISNNKSIVINTQPQTTTSNDITKTTKICIKKASTSTQSQVESEKTRKESISSAEIVQDSEESPVYGPINREPEEKLRPWKYERKQSGVRRFFRFFKELQTGTNPPSNQLNSPRHKNSMPDTS